MEILTPESIDLSEVAEHYIRTWSLSLEEHCKVTSNFAPGSSRLVQNYVTVSAEAGIDAVQIANVLAKELGWQALSADLLEFLRVQYDWRINLLDYANEAAADWFQDNFGRWLSKHVPEPCEYVTRLGNIVLLAAQHASYVFASPLAQFILPPDCGLSVRLVAPGSSRAKALSVERKCNLQEAKRLIREQDDADANVVRRCFHRNINDPELHDVVINLEHTSGDVAVDLILGDYLMRFAPMQVSSAFRLEDDRTSQRL
jgi:cytidylate kinase